MSQLKYISNPTTIKKRKTTLNKWSETKPLGFLRQYIHLHSVCVQNSILAKLKVLIYSFYFSFKNPKSPFTKLLIIKESYLFFESSFLCVVGFIVYFNAIYSNTIEQPAYSLGFEQWPAENLSHWANFNQTWHKAFLVEGIQLCSNVGQFSFPRRDNSEIVKKKLTTF